MEQIISKIADGGVYGLIGIVLTGSITTYGLKKLYDGVITELYRRGETNTSLQAQLAPFLNILSSVRTEIESV